MNNSFLVLYTANYDKDELEKQKITKVNFDELFQAFSAADKDENYRCEIGDHFRLYKVEPLDDIDVYEKIYIKIPKLKKIKLSAEATEIVARQLEDQVSLCDKLDREKSLLKMCETDIEKLNDQFFTLAKEKETYERKVIVKCLALLNEKKRFISEGMSEQNAADESSFDIHDFILNGGLTAKEEPIEQAKGVISSPVASTSRYVSKTTTPKSSTPSQKPKRTPSKKLFAQITQPSDSDEDDSFDILPINNNNSRKRKSSDNQQPDTSSVFKDFKVKTPKKQKREEKESSIEAKMDISETFDPREISSPFGSRSSAENEPKKYSDSNDVFKSQDICSQALFDEIKEDLKEDLNSSDSYKGRSLRSKKKNPYSLDTMNILDM